MPQRQYLLRGERIRELLEANLRHHAEFADDLELSASYWSKLVCGKRHLSINVRRRLLDHPVIKQAGLCEQELWFVQEAA